MNKIVGSIFMIVLSIFLILMFMNMSSDFDKIFLNEEFTTIENTASQEILQVHEEVYEITDIHINSIHYEVEDIVFSINVTNDGEIVLINNVTGIGDLVELTYCYEVESAVYTGVFIDAVPLIMIVMLLGGIGYILIKRS